MADDHLNDARALAQLRAGESFIVVIGAAGVVRVCRPEQVTWSEAEIGDHTIELHAKVLAVVCSEARQSTRRTSLRPLANMWAQRFASRGQVLAMPTHLPEVVAVTRARFEQRVDPAARERYFAGRSGRWLIIEVVHEGPHPRCLHADPFTTVVPCSGSYVVSAHGRLHAPVRGPVDPWLIEWTFRYFPSGYYVPVVLARNEVIDQDLDPRAALGDEPSEDPPRLAAGERGAVHVHRQLHDGRARLEQVCRDLDAARSFVAAHPKHTKTRWLLSSVADFVHVH